MWIISKWLDNVVGKRIYEADEFVALQTKVDVLNRRLDTLKEDIGFIGVMARRRGSLANRLTEVESERKVSWLAQVSDV